MKPKPGHLGLKYAEQFKDSSIAEAYHHRPPYADETIHKLVALITDEPRTVLDVGCGSGDLARRLAGLNERLLFRKSRKKVVNEVGWIRTQGGIE